MDFGQMMTDLRKLALEAGHVIMKIYGSDDFQVDIKDDESPVTIADKKADAIISAGLRALYPNVALVTEEQAETHEQAFEAFFIVDPLDGTKEFIKRRGDFTVNIAYVEAGIPRFGIVYAPAKGRLFYTQADGTSVEELAPFSLDKTGTLKPIRVSKPDNQKLKIVASKSHRDQATDDYIAKYNCSEIASAGSSLKFCLVATGEADFYPRLGRTMEWDTAAGDAVLRGAGGEMRNFADHSIFRYGKQGFENEYFLALAAGVQLHN